MDWLVAAIIVVAAFLFVGIMACAFISGRG